MHNALSLYAMKRIFCFRIVASDKTRVIAACVDKNCGWRVYAVTLPNTLNLEVRTVTMEHNCDVTARSRYGSKATAKILAGLLRGKFANGKKGPRACELPEMVLSELNVMISNLKLPSSVPRVAKNLNAKEFLNAAMQKAVDYPIVSMVEFIRAMLMRWFWCRRTFAGKTRTRCTPEIEELLIDHLKESLNCAVNGATDWIYQVNDEIGCEFIVDLEKKTCTCRVFDVLMVPCCHALAAGRIRNIDPYTLISRCYFVGPWREKYKGFLMPRPNEKDVDIPEELTEVPVNPPRTKRQGGRPKKRRIPSQGEVHHKKKGVTKCGRCFGQGHNRKTCSTLI